MQLLTRRRGRSEIVEVAAIKTGSGAELVVVPLLGDKMEYVVKFNFLASNNEAEYGALILGLQIYINAGSQRPNLIHSS